MHPAAAAHHGPAGAIPDTNLVHLSHQTALFVLVLVLVLVLLSFPLLGKEAILVVT